MSYALDPELVEAANLFPTMDLGDVAASRAVMDALVAAAPSYAGALPLHVEDRAVPSRFGQHEIGVRTYLPPRAGALLPAVVLIHGGGFVAGDLDLVDKPSRQLAEQTGAYVVSVDYRLAPENPYPSGAQDCYSVLVWLADHAGKLGIDPDRVALVGESAGAGLAATVSVMARNGSGPRIAFQYLGIPELDDRLETTSMRAFTDTPVWNRRNAELSWRHYLGAGPVDDLAVPARVADLEGLPPSFVAICEFDPLRDEGIAYGQRLVEAGVSTEIHLYPGTFHGCSAIESAAVSRRMVADKIAAVSRGLASTAPFIRSDRTRSWP